MYGNLNLKIEIMADILNIKRNKNNVLRLLMSNSKQYYKAGEKSMKKRIESIIQTNPLIERNELLKKIKEIESDYKTKNWA